MGVKELYEDIEAIYDETWQELVVTKLKYEEIKKTDDWKEYLKNPNIKERREKHSKIYEVEQKYHKLKKKEEECYATLVRQAKDLKEQLEERINILNEKLKSYEEGLKSVDEEVKVFEANIEELKNTKEYNEGNETVLINVERLQLHLKASLEMKDKLTNIITNLKEDISSLENQVWDLKFEYEELKEETVSEQTEKDQPEDIYSDTSLKPDGKKKKQTNTVVYGEPEGDESTDTTNNKEKTDSERLKKEFEDICSKVSRGKKLSSDECSKLASIMKDPKKYDELDLTIGVIFNNSKALLQAMLHKSIDTTDLLRRAKEELGIEIEKPNKENDLVSSHTMRKKGLKMMLNDPDIKLVSMETLKKIKDMDRSTLTDEQAKIYDEAVEHLNEFKDLREAVNTYNEVRQTRKKSRKFNPFAKKTVALPGAEEETITPETPSDPNIPKKRTLGDELSEKVYTPTEEEKSGETRRVKVKVRVKNNNDKAR